jgi:hypothetical protein
MCLSFGATFMRLLPVAVVALAAVLLSSHHASAFSSDPASGTTADGSARYVDPDDQIRSRFGGIGGEGGESQLGYDRGSDRRKMPATEVITGQGVLAPNSFFSATPSRR